MESGRYWEGECIFKQELNRNFPRDENETDRKILNLKKNDEVKMFGHFFPQFSASTTGRHKQNINLAFQVFLKQSLSGILLAS